MSRDSSLHASSLNNSAEITNTSGAPVLSGHTPTPWIFDVEVQEGWKGRHQIITVSSGETLIASYQTDFVEYPETDEENAANAAFIVRAVNSHEALVKALEITQRMIRGEAIASAVCEMKTMKSLGDVVAAALASAREVQP